MAKSTKIKPCCTSDGNVYWGYVIPGKLIRVFAMYGGVDRIFKVGDSAVRDTYRSGTVLGYIATIGTNWITFEKERIDFNRFCWINHDKDQVYLPAMEALDDQPLDELQSKNTLIQDSEIY